MSEVQFKDLREFVEICKQLDEVKEVEGADWNLEIGALTEAMAELVEDPPMLLFDNVRDYGQGYRVLSLPIASKVRSAIALGLPHDKPKLELIRMAAEKLKNAKPIPPVTVSTGPIMENVVTGDAIDLTVFPVVKSHASDGGRYIGTGDSLINRDPDSGYVNMGTYRMQLHEKNVLGLWMSPGQQGRQICEKYWKEGKAAPIVATFGSDPLMFMASHSKRPWMSSELDYVGGLKGSPMEVIEGPITGLPIPAYAEIAIEGEVPPPEVDSRDEGPFGEWPGYYSGGTLGTGEKQPVIYVKALYYRNDPILVNEAPLWPGASKRGFSLRAGFLWEQLEKAGVQDVMGCYDHTDYLVAVSIKQRFPGHAKQTAMAVLGSAAAARNGRYVVIVDEDIDPSNLKEVLWAMKTRVDPFTDIQLIDGCWSTPLDPRMPPDKRASGDFTNSRAVFYAVRPYTWKDRFPKTSRSPADLRAQVVDKYKFLFKPM